MAELTRQLVCLRAAKEIKEGMYVNLGIGIPTEVSNYIPEDMEVFLHAENGALNYGRILPEEEADHELVNAGNQPFSLKPGASFFCTADAFAMMRGGHIDITILGAFQVSEKGDLASWKRKEDVVGAPGGSMDLAYGAKRIIALMAEHATREGDPRVVRECSLPLTGKTAVDTIITNLAVIKVTPDGLLLMEVAPGVTVDKVQAHTEPKLIISPELKEMEF